MLAYNSQSQVSGKRRQNTAAFTLIEVATGVAIIGILILAFYTMLANGFNMVRANRENLRASQILINRMEGLRLYTWSQITDTNLVPTTFTEYYYPLGASNAMGTVYFGSLIITNVDFSPPATYTTNRMRKVTVNLTWSTSGIQRSRSMSTLVAEYGQQNYIYTH